MFVATRIAPGRRRLCWRRNMLAGYACSLRFESKVEVTFHSFTFFTFHFPVGGGSAGVGICWQAIKNGSHFSLFHFLHFSLSGRRRLCWRQALCWQAMPAPKI